MTLTPDATTPGNARPSIVTQKQGKAEEGRGLHDTHHSDTKHNNILHNDTQHKWAYL